MLLHQAFVDIFDGFVEIAAIVDSVDYREPDVMISLRYMRTVKLPGEVILERILGTCLVFKHIAVINPRSDRLGG